MILPEALVGAIRHHMATHGDWHIARHRERWLPMDEREDWRRARAAYPDIKYLDEAGAGEEFLEFHRMMIRHYKWILLNTPGHNVKWYVWPRVPAIYMQRLPAHARTSALAGIERIIQDPASTAEDLGAFIERTRLVTTPGSDVHNLLHGVIGNIENEMYPNHPQRFAASMADLSVAHYNENFWILHGWIDDIYARWQTAHSIAVDQSPLDPALGGHLHHPPSPSPSPSPSPVTPPSPSPSPEPPALPGHVHHFAPPTPEPKLSGNATPAADLAHALRPDDPSEPVRPVITLKPPETSAAASDRGSADPPPPGGRDEHNH